MAFFSIFSGLFTLLFLFIFSIILVSIIKSIKTWNKNNHSPRLSVPAKVVAKRTNVSHHNSAGDMHHSHTSTSYYVTFEVESGDRMEFVLPGMEYGMMVEGDSGKLSFQGTRFLSFERM